MKRRTAIPYGSDTSADAEKAQWRVLRAMPPDRKVALVEDANRTARRLALAGIDLRFPHVPATLRFRLLMDVVLGEGLAARAFGRREETRGA